MKLVSIFHGQSVVKQVYERLAPYYQMLITHEDISCILQWKQTYYWKLSQSIPNETAFFSLVNFISIEAEKARRPLSRYAIIEVLDLAHRQSLKNNKKEIKRISRQGS